MLTEIGEKQQQLDSLALAFQGLRCVAVELHRATRRQTFAIGNDTAYYALASLRRMIIIDLAAWVRSLYPGWLQRNIQGATLANLRASKRRTGELLTGSPLIVASAHGTAGVPPEVRKAILTRRAEALLAGQTAALRRLFGEEAAARGRAEAGDVTRLVRRLERFSVRLDKLRNEHAHRFGTTDPTFREPRYGDLAKRFRYCGRLLNDFRMLLEGVHYLMPGVEPSKNDPRARDLVDLVLLGTISNAVEIWQPYWDKKRRPFLYQQRDAHYARLHAWHRTTDKTKPFNEPGRSHGRPR
jgi:hypothetical protein